jgi:predicted Zn-dependent protease
MPLYVKRVHPDPKWQDAIVAAVTQFEKAAALMAADYAKAVEGLPMTERIDLDEMVI